MKIKNGEGVIREVTKLKNILPAFKDYPIVLYSGGTSEKILKKVADLWGGAKDNPTFADIRDIKPQSSTLNQSIALSQKAHPPHTDGTFSNQLLTVFMLQCVSPDIKGGGQGIFWNVNHMIDVMPKDIKDFLYTTKVCYSRVQEDGLTHDTYTGYMLFDYLGKPSIRWRFDSVIAPQLLSNASKKQQKDLLGCIAWVTNYFATQPPLEISYVAGDIVICNNLQVFHGRRSLKGNSRHFRRAWLTLID